MQYCTCCTDTWDHREGGREGGGEGVTSVILYEEEDAVRTLGTTGRVGGWEGGRG